MSTPHLRLCVVAVISLLCAPARAGEEITPLQLSDRVLGLFDSTEADHRGERLLRERVQPALARLGLTLQLHDADRGPPPETSARAVVTAFSDGRLRNATAHCRWLAAQAQRGRRLVLLENFGAYQDAASGKWTEREELNRVFMALGLLYDAQWTDDAAKLRVLIEDAALLRPGRQIDPAVTRLYYRFRPMTPEAVRAHVVVERLDLAQGRSAVVATSSGGGMALSRYYQSDSGEEYLDLERFLDLSLFSPPAGAGRLLILYEPRHQEPLLGNVRWALRYARLEADYLRLADLPTLRRGDLRRYGAVVLATGEGLRAAPGPSIAMLERWVREDGGGLVAPGPTRHPGLDAVFGISGDSGAPVRARALRFVRDLYPGTAGTRVHGDGFYTDLQPLQLQGDAELVATADPSGPPLLFRRRHGAGRALYYNDGALSEKPWRGALLQLLVQALPVAVVPVLGSLVYFVDDCPMPMWGARRDPVQRDLGLTDTAFYRDVFFPDLLRLARDYSLRLTFAAIFSYDDRTRGGFSAMPFYLEGGEDAPLRLAREAQRLGHEIALHGYNHQSLVERPAYTSKGWPSRQAMIEALRVARAEWQRVLGPGRAPFTYVAPNNHVGRLGKEAVQAVFPEIRVLSGLYLEDGPSRGQEYGDDPDVPRLLALPRASSEFYLEDHTRLAVLDALMLVGAFSHFVHPDDIYDPERNGGMSWAELYRRAREMMSWLRTTYPWLQPMTAREAHGALLRFRGGAFGYEVSGNEVRVHLDPGAATTFLLRVEPGVSPEPRDGVRLLHGYPSLGYFYFSASGPVATIELRR